MDMSVYHLGEEIGIDTSVTSGSLQGVGLTSVPTFLRLRGRSNCSSPRFCNWYGALDSGFSTKLGIVGIAPGHAHS